jgi:nitrite reductase/ring-hydroxylating ferredoxin subunit
MDDFRAIEWDRVASMLEIHEASAAGRGLRVDASANWSRPPLALFLDKAGTIFALQDACPHAGHPLSNGDLLYSGDIEDIAPQCGLTLIIACPAHSFTYDASR